MTKSNGKNEPVITIKVGDWANEYQETEPHIASEEDLIALATQSKMTTPKVARLAIMAREYGNAPLDILPENKPLLNSGAAVAISSLISRRHIEAQLENGKTVEVREFVAPVREEENEGHFDDVTHIHDAPSSSLVETFVPVQSEEAKVRAIDYLYGRVPGYIYGRLKIIAVNGGDVKEAVKELKSRIDEMVERLG